MIKANSRLITLLIVLLFVTVSCRKPVAAPPPPPPPPAPAPPPPPAPTITLSAAPETVQRGQGTTLTWQAANAANVAIEPGIGNVPGNGNRQVTPVSSVTYTATATGPGGTATDTVRITVNVPPPPPAAAPPPRPAPPAPSMADLFRQNVQNILFDYDKSDIRPDQVGRLQGNANFLRQQGAVRITVEGHADERGSQEYNLGLGDRRANAIKQFLLSQGIAEGRINVITYGEERPECRDMNEDCYSRNRRGAFVLNP